MAASYAADVRARGGTISVGCGVTAIGEARRRGGRRARARQTSTRRRSLVCAGAWSDRLAVAAGAPAEPRIVPFRGGYLKLRPERAHLVRASLYPVPDPELPFLGAHLTRTIAGDVLLGPSALIVGARDAYRPLRVRGADLRDTLSWPGTWRLAARSLARRREGAPPGGVAERVRRRRPPLRPRAHRRRLRRRPVRVRAQALARDGSLVDDFVVSRTGRALFVRNAPSPAATASLPLARLIADGSMSCSR